MDTEGSQTRVPVEPDVIQHLRRRTGRRTKERTSRSIVVGERKVCSVTYANDIVLMADRQEELKEVLKRFKKCLKEAELELSTEKTKIIVFEKRRNKSRQRK